MKAVPNDWINTKTLEVMYGIDVFHDGKWKHFSRGEMRWWPTPEARDEEVARLNAGAKS